MSSPKRNDRFSNKEIIFVAKSISPLFDFMVLTEKLQDKSSYGNFKIPSTDTNKKNCSPSSPGQGMAQKAGDYWSCRLENYMNFINQPGSGSNTKQGGWDTISREGHLVSSQESFTRAPFWSILLMLLSPACYFLFVLWRYGAHFPSSHEVLLG